MQSNQEGKNEYNPKEIESKWMKIWEENKIYKTPEVLVLDKSKPKMHVLDMFPYPSGEGLHTGHAKVFGASDTYARLKRMQGYNVLHATGWDAFGLPAEQFAIKNKLNPKISTKKNTETYEHQMRMMGFSYDWDRTVNTTSPEFYKWTQWAFKEMYKKGLCFESNEPINWCPSCKTGLANEDLDNGVCERCGSVVEKKPIRQWVIKITDYAEKLLSGVDNLDWRDSIKEMQRNWIGKSEGAEINFSDNNNNTFTIFTTRPDTLFGCTYCVLSPEHELVKKYLDNNLISNKKEVQEYLEVAKNKTEIERTALGKEKTGVKLEGVYATNPANGKQIPIYIADYVLANYGTGAIMAVPAHDERDFECANKFGIEKINVIEPVIEQRVGDSAIRDDLEFVKREVMSISVRDPKTNKYLVISWKNFDMKGFVTGGTEGEEIETAARREVIEETGYKNLKLNYIFPNCFHTKFYHRQKKINRHARWTYVSFDLINDEKVEVAEEEKKLHEILWIDEKDLAKTFSFSESQVSVFILQNKIGFFTQEGYLVNSGKFDGLTSGEAKIKITEMVGGKIVTKYKLKDWVFARQRYWGEPFPIVFDENHKSYVVADSELPVVLPDVESYEPTGDGESPLKNIKDWVEVKGKINSDGEFVSDEGGKTFYRETNTMPQWAGSSWYWLRYMDPHNENRLVGVEEEKYWASNGYSVDVYFGGLEHATRHLIYGRFWNQFLFDQKIISRPEPFKRLEAVGLVLGKGGVKMSKRLGNVVNPDDVVKQFGADTLRAYIAFAGDYHDSFAWDSNSIVGPRRFIERVWNLQYKVQNNNTSSEDLEILLNQTIKKVTEDYEQLKFNTAIAQMMIFVNAVEKNNFITLEDYKILIKLLAPICPFVTEEIWSNFGNKESIHLSDWPKFDDSKTTNKNVNIAVQINGKLRDTFSTIVDLEDSKVIELAKNTEGYQKWVGQVEPKKIIVVKNKVVNIVV